MAKQLHQQPGRVAAGATAQREGFFRRLYARLHADQVADVLVQTLVGLDQKVDAALAFSVQAAQVFFELRRARKFDQIRLQLVLQGFAVLERHFLGRGLHKKVKGIEHCHLGDQIHRDLELGGLLGKHQPRLVVGKRVLLPVDEMFCRLNTQAVRQDAAAAMRRRTQAHDLGTELHRAVVAVVGNVVQGYVDGHMWLGWRSKTVAGGSKGSAYGKTAAFLCSARVLHLKQETGQTLPVRRPKSVHFGTPTDRQAARCQNRKTYPATHPERGN